MRTLTLQIDGMSCGHCLNAVNRALAAVPGVTVDSVRIGRAELHYDEASVEPRDIASAVTDAGYRATVTA
ncbi:MAG TPA: cation transporter [Gemmatimonadales bacterium]|nr:cation transporter [Gemmatimonadales bacterium]